MSFDAAQIPDNKLTISQTSGLHAALVAKQPNITGAAKTIALDDLAINKALISDPQGKVAVSAVTSAELGHLSGVTGAIQTQLDAKQATITLTDSRALVSNSAGEVDVSSVTSTELGYLDGVTGAIQTQLDAKQNNFNRFKSISF